MTKKKKIIIGLCILAAIIISFVGGSVLAKYRSQVTGEGVADIAKWVFEVNGDTSNIQTISLNKTYDESTLINGKIAPGTEGAFDIVVDATGSDVGVDYAVLFPSETNKPTNLKFTYGGQTYSSLKDMENVLIGTINANDKDAEGNEDKVDTLTIGWFWKYNSGNDVVDTNEAIADLNYTFDVKVIGTQVLPQQ